MASRSRLPPTMLLLFASLFISTSRAREVEHRPALSTGDFGDCLAGQSPLEIDRFHLAYDAGNRTLALHLDGTSHVESDEFVRLHISIDAYGTNRLDMTFDPCDFNITSLCPLGPNQPITAHLALPVGDTHPLTSPPTFPYTLPDHEGTATLQISTTTKPKNESKNISCLRTTTTPTQTTLAHPAILAPILAFFALLAIASSFLTAAHGISVPHMRMHHAHSLSALVVFETLQSVFFAGALSVRWPALLPGWWANFGWAAGVVYAGGLVGAVGGFVGVFGSRDGSGGERDLGGGVPSRFLEGREGGGLLWRGGVVVGEGGGFNSSSYNSSFLGEYAWSGGPVAPGLPLPGSWAGFPGSLSVLGVPVADVFMVGLVWVLVAFGLVGLAVTGFKLALEGLAAAGKIKEDRLAYFRGHWTGYLGHAVLRTLVIAFFTLMTLTMLQFTIRVTVGPIAVATILFMLILIGIIWLVASGCKARTRNGRFEASSDRIVFYHKKRFGVVPGLAATRNSTLNEGELEVPQLFGIPFFRVRHINNDPSRPSVHLDEPFVKRFGWLTARYRRTRWWFLGYHVTYLFCRAAFLGGGWQSPRAQVYGVLVIDIVNFAIGAILAPFEGARNTVMGVWILGICKILTTGISIAFLPEFDLDRSDAAVLGILIIVIQALTVAALLVLIVLSAVSSWLSLMRNREEVEPDWMEPARVRYFTAMEKKARDNRFDDDTESAPPDPRFSVVSIQRRPKIEDEDEDAYAMRDLEQSQPTLDDGPGAGAGQEQATGRGRDRNSRISRTSSVGTRLSTGSLPRAARPYRASWSSRDFGGEPSLGRSDSVATKRLSGLSGITCVVVTDCDGPSTRSAASVKPQGSMWSLNTPSASRASSPSAGRRSREIVGSCAEGKRPPTALHEAPEPQE